MKTCLPLSLSLVLGAASAQADEPAPGLQWREPSLAVNLGLIQPFLLKGANVEADFRWGHFVASYSHGWGLELEGGTVVGDAKRQGITLHLPYTTGLGVGYSVYTHSLRSFFDVRAEAKLHRFEVAYDSADGATKTDIASYTTLTLGGGAYWTFVPFAARGDALRGLNVSTSVRFWPNVASTLAGGEVHYANARTGREEVHETARIGLANSPVLVNVSVGYVFQ